MSSPAQARVDSPQRILIVVGRTSNLAEIIEQYPQAKVVDEQDSLVQIEVLRVTPDIVICSGEYFHDLLKTATGRSSKARSPRLTARQTEVLSLIVRGCSNREVADYPGISERVVKEQVSALLRIFDASNRTELAMLVSHF